MDSEKLIKYLNMRIEHQEKYIKDPSWSQTETCLIAIGRQTAYREILAKLNPPGKKEPHFACTEESINNSLEG